MTMIVIYFYQIDTVKLFELKNNFISRESASWNDNIYEL